MVDSFNVIKPIITIFIFPKSLIVREQKINEIDFAQMTIPFFHYSTFHFGENCLN